MDAIAVLAECTPGVHIDEFDWENFCVSITHSFGKFLGVFGCTARKIIKGASRKCRLGVHRARENGKSAPNDF